MHRPLPLRWTRVLSVCLALGCTVTEYVEGPPTVTDTDDTGAIPGEDSGPVPDGTPGPGVDADEPPEDETTPPEEDTTAPQEDTGEDTAAPGDDTSAPDEDTGETEADVAGPDDLGSVPDVPTPPPCPVGTLFCPCHDAGICDLGLRCNETAGICEPKPLACQPGSTGCQCKPSGTCARLLDDCVLGVCQPGDCAEGSLNCACQGESCDAGLACQGGVCAANVGALGGPCYDGGTCSVGHRCQGAVCVPCVLGTLGCACDSGVCGPQQGCADGVCVSETDPTAVPPTDPKCYTPCIDGYSDAGGTWHPCKQGLVDGCVGGNECVGGSCVTPGGSPSGCENDSGCAEFQRCILGSCYSDCLSDTECAADQRCHKKACRRACDQVSLPCPQGWHCEVDETLTGACQPLSDPDSETQVPIEGSLSATPNVLAMTPDKATVRVRLANTHVEAVAVTIRKVRHTRYLDDGTAETASRDESPTCSPVSACPLWWLHMGLVGQASLVQQLALTVPANGYVDVEFANAAGVEAATWLGDLEVVAESLNTVPIALQFAPTPEGRWSGNVYYFTQFGADEDFKTWQTRENPAVGAIGSALIGTKDDTGLIESINNAFIQRWSAFRRGKIGWDEFQAVLTSTRTGSWSQPAIADACVFPEGACYPYDGSTQGFGEYTSNQVEFPVPTGVVELPMGVALHLGDPQITRVFSGRIESRSALHYAGNPAVTLTLNQGWEGCSRETSQACLNFLDGFDANVEVGGRYATTEGDWNCAGLSGQAQQTEVPWLVPGFTRDTDYDPASGLRYRYECQSKASPWPLNDPVTLAANQTANRNLARSNPIPDGRAMRRKLRLVDGALVNRSTLIVIFEESFASFLGADDTEGFSAYGFMVLHLDRDPYSRADDDGDGTPDLFEGASYSVAAQAPSDELQVTCSEEVLDEVLPGQALTGGNAALVMWRLLDGKAPSESKPAINPTKEQAHTYCEDTGLFDDGAAGTSTECPIGSRVDYFTVNPVLVEIANHPCQALTEEVTGPGGQKSLRGTCGQTLNAWRAGKLTGPFSPPLVQYRPAWRCEQGSGGATVYCDSNRADLLAGKVILAAEAESFTPLSATVDDAFRYKVKFRSRQGQNIGFAPDACVPDSDQIPYCYDAEAIERSRERVDCLLHVWSAYWTDLGATEQLRLRTFLSENFATSLEFPTLGPPVSHDGFERLYSELLVMLGDEAYTRALSSRFDLAESLLLPFEGAALEPGGINLSGIAGYEMYSLYQASQYYQEALDRFYAQSPILWTSLNAAASKNFMTAGVVTSYFTRLIGASTHLSRASSEIARKYQSFDRADLARRVVERAYSRAYLESIVMARLMQQVVAVSAPESRTEIRRAVEDAALQYRMSLLEMRGVYTAITDEVNIFGMAPDFIPFPTVDSKETLAANAFEQMIIRVKAKMATAREREEMALSTDRTYETDAAQFQSELVRIRNTFEDQLADLCGEFETPDEQVLPATAKYAYLTPITRALGDPCGFMGNGEIHTTLAELEDSALAAEAQLARIDKVYQQAEIEAKLQSDLCNIQTEIADWVYAEGIHIISMRDEMRRLEFERTKTQGLVQIVTQGAQSLIQLAQVNSPTALVLAALGAQAQALAAGYSLDLTLETQKKLDIQQSWVEEAEAYTVQNEKIKEACDAGKLSSDARVKTLLLEIGELQLELLRSQLQMQTKLSEVDRLRLKARRIQAQQTEAEQLSINVEAARNDPNVRIYRNDAVINADVAFEDARRELYRATLVLEYYTSQSFAQKGELFLVRMVARGDYNLENYLADLQNAFYDFEDIFGLADLRVAVLSLKNDLLRIPTLNDDGIALSSSARTKQMRERLADPGLLDASGYLVVPFRTDLESLSPLTQNHKIAFIESNIEYSIADGDEIARLYLRQKGTSTVRTVDGTKAFYKFPTKTAVLNPMRNGIRSPYLDASIYRNTRLRERPFASTEWELVLNQVDEEVNKDIDVQALEDIKIYLYYTDFTAY